MSLKLDFKALEKYFLWQDLSNSKESVHPKFSRRFIKPIRYLSYGIATFICSKKIHSEIECDVLVLHRSKKNRIRGLRNHLTEKIKEQGLKVIEIEVQKNSVIFKDRLLTPPPLKTPLKFLFHASYSYYIIKKYSPKVIMTESNGSCLTPFLKAFLPSESKLVHIAHCVTTDNYRHHSLIDYDYFFLYGQSSLDKLRNRKTLFGSCHVVLTGSYHFAQHRFSLEPSRPNNNILLLAANQNMEQRPHVQKYYSIIEDWINQHPEYKLSVKKHPASTFDFWDKAMLNCPNISIVDKKTSMQEALGEVSITLGIYTNAVIDAALLNRPSLLVSDHSINDELNIEKFFPARCKDKTELHSSIEMILENYAHYLEKTIDFARYHLEHQQDSVDFMASTVNAIARGEESFPIETLKGTSFRLH